MARIRVRTVIDAPRPRVWADVKDLASHIEWMDDAEGIEFISQRRSGVGTAFICRTRIGPLSVDDEMVVTEWRPGRRIGVHHSGAVTGDGRIVLRRRLRGGTVLIWKERLRFPWYLGGPFGAVVGRFALKRVWRHNLANLAARLSSET